MHVQGVQRALHEVESASQALSSSPSMDPTRDLDEASFVAACQQLLAHSASIRAGALPQNQPEATPQLLQAEDDIQDKSAGEDADTVQLHAASAEDDEALPRDGPESDSTESAYDSASDSAGREESADAHRASQADKGGDLPEPEASAQEEDWSETRGEGGEVGEQTVGGEHSSNTTREHRAWLQSRSYSGDGRKPYVGPRPVWRR